MRTNRDAPEGRGRPCFCSVREAGWKEAFGSIGDDDACGSSRGRQCEVEGKRGFRAQGGDALETEAQEFAVGVVEFAAHIASGERFEGEPPREREVRDTEEFLDGGVIKREGVGALEFEDEDFASVGEFFIDDVEVGLERRGFDDELVEVKRHDALDEGIEEQTVVDEEGGDGEDQQGGETGDAGDEEFSAQGEGFRRGDGVDGDGPLTRLDGA